MLVKDHVVLMFRGLSEVNISTFDPRCSTRSEESNHGIRPSLHDSSSHPRSTYILGWGYTEPPTQLLIYDSTFVFSGVI